MLPFEFNQLDKHEVDKFRPIPKFMDHDLKCIPEKFIWCIPFHCKNKWQYFLVGMLIDDDGLEDLVLARKVVIDASQGKFCTVSNLAHGSGMITLFEEKADRGILDCQPGHFTFCLFFFFHRTPHKNERTFVLILCKSGILSRE